MTIQVIWIKSSGSDRGQLWDYPESPYATHLKHLSLSFEPYLTSLAFFLPLGLFFLPQQRKRCHLQAQRIHEQAQRIHSPSHLPCPLPSYPWLGHLPCSVVSELLAPCLGSGNTRGLCRAEGGLPSWPALGHTCV